MKKELIVLSLIIFLFCGCTSSPDEQTTSSTTSELTTTTSSSTTTMKATTTTTKATTTSLTTTTTALTTTTTLPEFYDANIVKIDGVALNANLIGIMGGISAEENCDGEPCGGATIKLVTTDLSGSGDESTKLAIIGVRLSNFEKTDAVFDGSFFLELSNGSVYRRSSDDEYDLFGFHLSSNDTFTVPAKGAWVNKLVFKVPRLGGPQYLLYQSGDGRKYKYNLKKT